MNKYIEERAEYLKLVEDNKLFRSIFDNNDPSLSNETLLEKLKLLQQIRFKKEATSSFFSKNAASRLPLIEGLPALDKDKLETESPTQDSLNYDKNLFEFLCDVQLELVNILVQRKYKYEMVVSYDQNKINESTIFVNYMQTSKNKEYNKGSLTLDLHRGVKYQEKGKPLVDMTVSISSMRNRVSRTLQFISNDLKDIEHFEKELNDLRRQAQSALFQEANGKLSREDVVEIHDSIADRTALIAMAKSQIEIYRKDLEKIQPLVEDQYLIVKNMAGSNEKKADVLNRFGHQMVIAELMNEVQKVFQIRDFPKVIVAPLHEVAKSRVFNVIRDEDENLWVDVKLCFDGFGASNTSTPIFGAFDRSQRHIEWTKDANILKESRGSAMEVQGRVQVVPHPDNKDEYCMQVTQFRVISHTPDLVPREEYNLQKHTTIQDEAPASIENELEFAYK